MATKYKTTPREKQIIKLMEMVIDTLKYCDDLDDPAFAMYDVMKDAVEKEVRYPMAVSYTHLTLPTKRIV